MSIDEADLTEREREMLKDCIPDADLQDMIAGARQMVSDAGTREYNYRTEYRGGPRNVDPELLLAASIELGAARMVYEQMSDRVMEATLILYERMAEMLDQGIPVDFVAEHSGFKHRPSVYRIVNKQLPDLRRALGEARRVREAIGGRDATHHDTAENARRDGGAFDGRDSDR